MERMTTGLNNDELGHSRRTWRRAKQRREVTRKRHEMRNSAGKTPSRPRWNWGDLHHFHLNLPIPNPSEPAPQQNPSDVITVYPDQHRAVRTDLANRPTEPMLVSFGTRYTMFWGNRRFLQSGLRRTTPVHVGVTCGSGISVVRVGKNRVAEVMRFGTREGGIASLGLSRGEQGRLGVNH